MVFTTVYTPEIAKEICDTISISGKSLQMLSLENDHWPTYSTIWKWIQEDYQGMSDAYAKAKEKQADHLCESILTIIDKPETFIDENGRERTDVQMCRIKVDALKWQAMKLKPKRYDKYIENLEADHTRVKQELEELRRKLNKDNIKEY